MNDAHQTDRGSEQARRIYFEQLATLLLARGIDGERIGQTVAELDDHVVMSGYGPIEELGPVGELANALAESMSSAKAWIWMAAGFALSGAVAVALASIFALIDGPQPGFGDLEFPVGFMVYIAVFASALQLVNIVKMRTAIGRARLEPGMWKLFLPFVAVILVTSLVTRDWTQLISTGAGRTLALVSVPAALVLGRLSMRHSRVDVPGRAEHLNRLHLGPWGNRR